MQFVKKVRMIPVPPKEFKKLKVAAYCRVSTKSKAQKASLMNQIGISMYFENENLDSMDSAAEAYITLAGAVAQEESRNMSENMQWAVMRRFEKGIFTNYKAFMGYRCVDWELVIVPEQAEIVKMIFDFYIAGYTFAQIKTKLEKQNIRTTTGKSEWDVTTIQKMQKNEKYKGDALLQKTYTEDYLNGIRKKNIEQRPKYYVKDSHPAIISAAIFDRVQEKCFREQDW